MSRPVNFLDDGSLHMQVHMEHPEKFLDITQGKISLSMACPSARLHQSTV